MPGPCKSGETVKLTSMTLSLYPDNTISLIGMPGAGKSTLGKPLAARLQCRFYDTDALLEARFGMSLQAWLDQQDYLQLRQQEEQLLLEQDFERSVVATGGSVVYSESAMRRLLALGPCIFLDISCATMLQRIGSGGNRGLAISKGTGLQDMYEERKPLYQKWASVTLDCNSGSVADLTNKLELLIKESFKKLNA